MAISKPQEILNGDRFFAECYHLKTPFQSLPPVCSSGREKGYKIYIEWKVDLTFYDFKGGITSEGEKRVKQKLNFYEAKKWSDPAKKKV